MPEYLQTFCYDRYRKIGGICVDSVVKGHLLKIPKQIPNDLFKNGMRKLNN